MAPGVRRVCLLGLLFLTSCFGKDIEPYSPQRPIGGPGGRWSPARAGRIEFPERSVMTPRSESPPETLARVDAIYRSIALTTGPEEPWLIGVLKPEIDSIRAEIDALGLGGGSVMRLRLGGLSDAEAATFRQAAALYVRWAFAKMRTGQVDERIRGAQLLREARQFDPDNPLLAVILSGYLELGGFRSNAIRELDLFDRDHGPNDLIDLVRIRRRERAWKLREDGEALAAAREICDTMTVRRGGWERTPGWLRLERAWISYLADSTETARDLALSALQSPLDASGEPDTLTAVQAHLLLGVVAVRQLEYEEAQTHFDRAVSLGMDASSTAELTSWLTVPWDLMTEDQRLEFDRAENRDEWLETFWRNHDPILATPDVFEDRIEYGRRVGETWFAFNGIDVSRPGPLTEPGTAVLRFGWPTEWRRLGLQTLIDRPARVNLDFSTYLTWEFRYRLRDERGTSLRSITFQDRGGLARLQASDSLRGPAWPPFWFNYDFLGKGYVLNTDVARFRDWDGRARLVLSFDTLVPNYSVRYPLQGFRYEGDVTVQSAVLRRSGDRWVPASVASMLMDGESVIQRDREFRRRSTSRTVHGVERGVYRAASLMKIRDRQDRIVAIAVDNGRSEPVPGYGWVDLDASDLLLMSSLKNEAQEDREREIRDGLVVYGPDPESLDVRPRASRNFLSGEDLAFYLELYNLDHRDGVSAVSLTTTLERIGKDGSIEYSVTLTGSSSTLIRYGIDQWNVARSLGLQELQTGRYRLLVEAHDQKARQKVVRSADFSVVLPEDLIELYHWRRLEAPRTVAAVVEH